MNLKIVCLNFLTIFVISHQDDDFPVASLTQIKRGYYVANMNVGTPPTTFSVMFSPVVDIIFVPSVSCLTCLSLYRYDSKHSSTYMEPDPDFSETSITSHPSKAHITGVGAIDTIKIGGITIDEQPFLNVVKETNYDYPVDLNGMISLQSNNYSFITNMYNQGLIDNPLLGYYISQGSGEVSFGQPDPKHFSGDLTYLNITFDDVVDWEISIDNYTVDNEILDPIWDDNVAIMDVTVRNIQVGPKTCQQINEALGATLQSDGSYTFDCNTLDQNPSFSFIFNGQNFTLDPQDYVHVKHNQCVSYFVKSNYFGESGFNIGQPFFQKFYSVFDFGNRRIGFAEAK